MYKYLAVVWVGWACVASGQANGNDAAPYDVKLDTVLQAWDGRYDWAQVWPGSIPDAGRDGNPLVILTTQKEDNASSDFYLGVNTISSVDFGQSWVGPQAHRELEPHRRADGTITGLCDFVSGWHASTGKLLITGHTVEYADGHLAPAPYRRYTAYASFDPKTNAWTPWQSLDMGGDDTFYNTGSGMCQWVVETEGTILLPVYYQPRSADRSECYSVTVLRCRFDGNRLHYVNHGTELQHEVPRGFCEPSLTKFHGRYYLTLRNDVRAYVTSSANGQDFPAPKPWTFDDDTELGSYNTMQHWVTHSDALFLVYTRRGAGNDHIIRNRAPLFMAQVDPETLRVIRSTERIVVPERGASLGNFGAGMISENETWITVGECMYSPECEKRGANGSVFAARIIWKKPNMLAPRAPSPPQVQ